MLSDFGKVKNLYSSTVFSDERTPQFTPDTCPAVALTDCCWLNGDRLADIPVISIIDDDELVRDAVRDLIRSLGYAAATHASAEDYLSSDDHWASSCVIADIQMPGMSGVDLQTQL